MAIDGFTVNGSALLYVGTGSAGALELLGYTQDGVDSDIQEKKGELFTDIFGPMVPHDFQDFGMDATVRAPLIAMDSAIFAKAIGRGDRTTLGLINTPGLVFGAAGYLVRVAIAAPLNTPWSFSKCLIRPGHGTRLATKANPYTISWYAFPWASVATVSGKDTPLFTRSLS
jgi:hypothetical protein